MEKLAENAGLAESFCCRAYWPEHKMANPKLKNGHNYALDIYTLQEPILHEKENEKSQEKH